MYYVVVQQMDLVFSFVFFFFKAQFLFDRRDFSYMQSELFVLIPSFVNTYLLL